MLEHLTNTMNWFVGTVAVIAITVLCYEEYPNAHPGIIGLGVFGPILSCYHLSQLER